MIKQEAAAAAAAELVSGLPALPRGGDGGFRALRFPGCVGATDPPRPGQRPERG